MTTRRRRSQRLILNVPIVVSGESSTGHFSEETQTLVVNAHGALIRLATPISPEQRLTLKHRASGEEEACRVVYVESSPKGKAKLGVEFVRPAPHFWHVAFPPEDWTPVSVASEPGDSVKTPNVLPQGGVTYEMVSERRCATRYNFGAIAEVIDVDERDALVSLTRDLSLSGCFVETTTPCPEGTRVRVRIIHSAEEFVAVGNVTANVTATGMRIAFTRIQPNDRAILERWLRESG